LTVVVYIVIVAFIMTNAENLFGDAPDIFGVATFLMLFVLSAAVVGSAIFARPVIMYLEGQKKDALTLLSQTILWLLAMVAIALIVLVVV
jgi:ABC-type multidrug transport system permease subunit